MKKGKIGYFVLASAVVWGVTIIGCSLKLSTTPYYNEIDTILSSGAVFHLLFIWGPFTIMMKQKKTKSPKSNQKVSLEID